MTAEFAVVLLSAVLEDDDFIVFAAFEEKLQELAARQGDVCGFRTYVHKGCKSAQDICRSLGMHEKEYVVFEDML